MQWCVSACVCPFMRLTGSRLRSRTQPSFARSHCWPLSASKSSASPTPTLAVALASPLAPAAAAAGAAAGAEAGVAQGHPRWPAAHPGAIVQSPASSPAAARRGQPLLLADLVSTHARPFAGPLSYDRVSSAPLHAIPIHTQGLTINGGTSTREQTMTDDRTC